MLSIGQDIFCTCSIDIIEYSVVEIRTSESGTFYVLKSKKGVGRNRNISILVAHGEAEILRYIELIETEYNDSEYGLEPFTTGTYHTTLKAAKSKFAEEQIKLLNREKENLAHRLNEIENRIKKWAVLI